MSPKKGGKITGGPVGKRTMIDPTASINSALSSFPSQGPTPMNKGGAMTANAMTPGQSQSPTTFNPNSTMNLGGAMTPNAISNIGYGASQGPTTFDPTEEMNRTTGRGAGAFGMQGRSLVSLGNPKFKNRSL